MMLHDEQASVKEVGRSVGYSEAGYFSRVFKKETGVPPSVYQKKCKKDKNVLRLCKDKKWIKYTAKT